MPRLIPCSTCHNHIRATDGNCPHCGATVRTTVSPAVPALILGLALTGCPEAEPAYGVPVTTTEDGDTATDDTGDTGTDMGTAEDTTETTTLDAGESEYGVASTGNEGEASKPGAPALIDTPTE